MTRPGATAGPPLTLRGVLPTLGVPTPLPRSALKPLALLASLALAAPASAQYLDSPFKYNYLEVN